MWAVTVVTMNTTKMYVLRDVNKMAHSRASQYAGTAPCEPLSTKFVRLQEISGTFCLQIREEGKVLS
jgi:hypothetical protein